MGTDRSQNRRKAAAAWLSVASNTTLVLGKVAVGLWIGSIAILSEAIHSGIDLVAACIALFAVKKAGLPADRDHPFGHGKFENVSGTAEALLIFAAAAWIVLASIRKLLHPAPLEYAAWGAAVMLVSTAVNLAVSSLLFRVGKETHSVALLADGWHLRTDVYTSAGVMVAMAILWVGGHLAPTRNFAWLDPAVALGVAALILRAAWRLTRESARDLLDVRLPEVEEEWIRGRIAALRPAVKGCHRLRTRKAGPYRFVEMHMIVDPEMSVRDSHRLTEDVAQAIETRFPDASVLVHIEPCDGRCEPVCEEGCLLPEAERKRQPVRR